MGGERSRLDLEREAFRAWTDLLDQAERVRNLFGNARLEVPDRLRRLLDDEPSTKRRAVAETHPDSLCPLRPGPVPPEFRPDQWIFVEEQELSVRTRVLATLRAAHPEGVRSRDLAQAAAEAREGQNLGSVYNLGGQLEAAGVIKRDGSIWTLEQLDVAPVMTAGAAWGPPHIFSKQEVATYRRAAIRHLLALPAHANGLQIIQITNQLIALPWLHAPVSKDLVKMDIDMMHRSGEVTRTGRSRNVRLVRAGDP